MRLRDEVREFERKLIIKALRKTRGNMSQAGKILETHRNTIISRCNSLGIDPSAFLPTPKSAYNAKYRAQRKAAGLCATCGKFPAGANGGTISQCGKCAEANRARQRLGRSRRIGRPPKPIVPRPLDQVFRKKSVSSVDEKLRLAAMVAKSHVTQADISRRAVC